MYELSRTSCLFREAKNWTARMRRANGKGRKKENEKGEYETMGVAYVFVPCVFDSPKMIHGADLTEKMEKLNGIRGASFADSPSIVRLHRRRLLTYNLAPSQSSPVLPNAFYNSNALSMVKPLFPMRLKLPIFF